MEKILKIIIFFISLNLFGFGYFRISNALNYITNDFARHYGELGLLYITISMILLGVFYFINLSKSKLQEKK